MNNIVQGFTGQDPAKGHLEVKETESNSYFWTVRVSPSKYKDDVLIQLTQQENGCLAVGKARAKSMTLFNNGDTYCDIWNILTYTDVFSDLEIDYCRVVPVNPVKACVAY